MPIAAESLRPGQNVLVDGFISFSRLARPITGTELAARIKREIDRGSHYPTKTDHTTIALSDAQVVYADPANPTLEEKFVAEKIYTIGKGENAGKQAYSIDNKGATLPQIFQPNPVNPGETQTHSQLILESDLATGLKVTLVLNTFQSAEYAKKGVGLQQVILHEPAKYYHAGVSPSLAARGIIITGDVTRVSAADAIANGATAGAAHEEDQGAGYPANTDPATGLPMPGNPAALGLPVAAAVAAVVPVQAATPVAVVAPVAATPVAVPVAVAPAAPVETPEQELARLRAAAAAPVETPEQELARLRAAATGNASAFTAPVENPWNEGGAPTVATQGIAYTGG